MCEHGRLRTVGDRVFCCACGKELDLAFLAAKGPEKPAPEGKPEKNAPRKRTGKKAV